MIQKFSDLFKNKNGMSIDCSKHKYVIQIQMNMIYSYQFQRPSVLSANKCLDKKIW